MLFQDNLVGTAGTNLTAHAPDTGGPWNLISGSGVWELNGAGLLERTAFNPTGIAAVTSTTTYLAPHYAGSTDFIWQGGALGTAISGIMIAATDQNNGYPFVYNENTDQYELYSRIAGTETLLGATPTVHIAIGDTITWDVDAGILTILVNSNPTGLPTPAIATSPGAPFTTYGTGPPSGTGSGFAMDEFFIESL